MLTVCIHSLFQLDIDACQPGLRGGTPQLEGEGLHEEEPGKASYACTSMDTTNWCLCTPVRHHSSTLPEGIQIGTVQYLDKFRASDVQYCAAHKEWCRK